MSRRRSIIVTAQKREERLIDVPVSATVFDEERINLEGIVEGRDVALKTGGVALSDFGAAFGSDVIARGSGIGRLILSENATGLFRNDFTVSGASLAGRNLFDMDFFDIQRIEVLKGPQSALYGRNAVGGAIKIINNDAKLDDVEIIGRLKVGDEGLFEEQAIVNMPVVAGRFALRAGAIRRDFDGGHFTDQTGEEVDDERLTGGRLSLTYAPTDALKITSFLEAYTYRGPGLSVFTYTQGTDPYVKTFNTDVFADRDGVMAGFRADYDTSIGTFSYLGSYRTANIDVQDDFSQAIGVFNFGAFGNNLSAVKLLQDEFSAHSHELRYVGSIGDRISLIGGLDFMQYEDKLRDVVSGNTGLLVTSNFDRSSVVENSSYAAYAQLDFDLTDKLTFGAQLRYARDEKEFFLDATQFRTTGVFLAPTVITVNNLASEQRNYEHLMPGAILRYRLSPDLVTYAKVATGYRSGSANTDLGDTTSPIRPNFTQGKETTISYEIGLKGNLRPLGLRFGLAAFRQDFEDLQLNTTTTASINAFPLANRRNVGFLVNRGDEEQYGLELDVQYFRMIGNSGGRLLFNGAGSWIYGEYTSDDFANAPGQTSIVGNDAAMVRDFQVSLGGTYRQPLWSDVELLVNYTANGEFGGAEDFQNLAELDDFMTHNLRFGLTAPAWQGLLIVENLFDEQHASFSFDEIGLNNYTNKPFRVSLQASFKLGGL